MAFLLSLLPQGDDVGRLLEKLGSSQFDEQEQAARALKNLGPKALPVVVRALDDDDIQVRSWAKEICADIRKREIARIRDELRILLEESAAKEEGDGRGILERIKAYGDQGTIALKDVLLNARDEKVRRRAHVLLGHLRIVHPGGIPYEHRWAKHERSAKSEGALLAALTWLARHQNQDGGWSAGGTPGQCQGRNCSATGESDYDVGVTGLALLAFLGAGYAHLTKSDVPDPVLSSHTHDFGDVVRKGILRLVARQDRDGCIGERGPKYMYGHAIATEVFCEAFGMTSSESLKAPAQRALDFLLLAQNPGKGWRYSALCGDNDSSVTAWAVMALRSGELAQLRDPGRSYLGALAWYDEVTEKNGYCRTGYNSRGGCRLTIPSRNEAFDDHPSMSAAAIVSRIFIGTARSDPTLASWNLLLSDLPESKGMKIDFYYWYMGSLALFQRDGPEGLGWRKWRERVEYELLGSQNLAKDGCAWGSWNPEGERWDGAGGRVNATALNALTLETEYRFPRFLEK